jgi:hypothetical protein
MNTNYILFLLQAKMNASEQSMHKGKAEQKYYAYIIYYSCLSNSVS